MAYKAPDGGDAWFTYPTWFRWGDKETGGNVETGIDYKTPFHTPVYELWGGKVIASGYHDWGGEVDLQTTIPGVGSYIESYVHLDEIDANVKPGATIKPGQHIGKTGGENPGYPGAEHPALKQYSSQPHIEYDLWKGQPWAKPQPQSSIDPYPIIQQAQAGGGILDQLWKDVQGWNPLQQGLNDLGAGIQAGLTGAITGVWQAVWKALGVENGKDLLWRAGFVTVGLILTLIGLAMLFKGSAAAAPGQQLLQVLSQGGGGAGGGGKSGEGGEGGAAAGAPAAASGGVGEAAAAAA